MLASLIYRCLHKLGEKVFEFLQVHLRTGMPRQLEQQVVNLTEHCLCKTKANEGPFPVLSVSICVSSPPQSSDLRLCNVRDVGKQKVREHLG